MGDAKAEAALKQEIYSRWEQSILKRSTSDVEATPDLAAPAPTPVRFPAQEAAAAVAKPVSSQPQRSEQLSERTVPPPLPLYSFARETSGNSDVKDHPKTGISVPMIWPPPEHIHYVPPEPEAFYQATDRLVPEMLLHDADRLAHPESVLNRVVYDSIDPNPDHRKETQPALPPGSLRPYYTPTAPDDTTLVFESRFESGNLRRAIQVYPFEYDLILKPDINTRGHTQWFYFSIGNTRKRQRYKFNIINAAKPDSLFNKGMKPLIYSAQAATTTRIGWVRHGTDVCYYQNHIKRKCGYYHTLTFTLCFEEDYHCDNDTVHVAYCYPYTYSDLQLYLRELEKDPKRKNRFRRRPLCQTLAGNTCDLLTITSFACDPEALKARKGVVVSARVHPGESNASWMMKGLIDYLTGPSLDAKIVRDNFVFKIVPMLNPDGVVVGNYRCSLAGVDLNRSYLDPSRKLHPTIYNLKLMIKRFQEDREVIMFCDFHGHSRKMNIFMYGCEHKGAFVPQRRLRERIFPRMLWRNATAFSYNDCSFKIQRCKESTGRVVVHREHGLVNSYTLEASFAGPDFGRNRNTHFTTVQFEGMGHYFCDTILDFCDPDQTKAGTTLRELESMYPRKADKGSGAGGSNATSQDQDSDSDDSLGSDDDELPTTAETESESGAPGQSSLGRSGRSASTGRGAMRSLSGSRRSKAKNATTRKAKAGCPRRASSATTVALGAAVSNRKTKRRGSRRLQAPLVPANVPAAADGRVVFRPEAPSKPRPSSTGSIVSRTLVIDTPAATANTKLDSCVPEHDDSGLPPIHALPTIGSTNMS